MAPVRAAERRAHDLGERLQARRGEIEQALLARVYGIADPGEADPQYVVGLRAAVSAALDYGLAAIDDGENRSPQIPLALLAQARMAARNAIGLDIVLRCYLAGSALLGEFIVQETGSNGSMPKQELHRLLRAQATSIDRLLEAASQEYAREAQARAETSKRRLGGRIEHLLAGELLDTSTLRYDFAATHIAAIALGPNAEEAIRELARRLDRALLAVPRDEETLWAWLGSRLPQDWEKLERLLADHWPEEITLTLGEPGLGLSGWRLSHRQAAAALPVALRGHERFVRYADVALLAAVLQDDLLSTSLHQLYLAPLQAERGGGKTLCETLRTYLEVGRNVSSAAVKLGVARGTVTNRLRAAEELIGRPLSSAAVEIETALRLHSSTHAASAQPAHGKTFRNTLIENPAPYCSP